MIFVFVLAILIQTGTVLLWHVYVLAFLFGTVTAFNMTAEQTFIGEIAGDGNIRKAIALNNSINQLSRFIGPAIAGWLIASVGISPAFWLNGISILVSIICIWIIPGSSGIKEAKGSGLEQFAKGIHFLFHDKLLRLIVLFAAMQTFFGLSIVQLLPAVSTLILKGNASTLGALTGAAGAGAFIGTVFVLPFVQRIEKSCIAIGGAVIWAGLWYNIFSFSNNLYLSMLCQFMASLGAANVLTLSLALTQELTPVKMRGEMISTFLMIILGLQPFASYLVGKTADKIGVDVMMRINGGLLICLPVILLAIPALNRLKKTIKPVAVTKHVIG
jgi:MFS family permease